MLVTVGRLFNAYRAKYKLAPVESDGDFEGHEKALEDRNCPEAHLRYAELKADVARVLGGLGLSATAIEHVGQHLLRERAFSKIRTPRRMDRGTLRYLVRQAKSTLKSAN